MSYRLSYLENFLFSNFQRPASEAANSIYSILISNSTQARGELKNLFVSKLF